MIRTGAVLPAASAIVLTALITGPADRPSTGAADVRTARATAYVALGEVVASLEAAAAHVRDGASRTSAGKRPGEAFMTAAAEVDAAAEPAAQAQVATGELTSLGAADVSGVVTGGPDVDDLRDLADDLRATAARSDAFVALRDDTARVLGGLGRALAAVAAGDVGDAGSALDAARAGHRAVLRADVDSAALPIWIDATDAMIAAVESLIDATASGDRAAVSAANRELRALTEGAEEADRALAIALSEGAGSVVADVSRRLAAELEAAGAARSALGGPAQP